MIAVHVNQMERAGNHIASKTASKEE
jgi:hypothetical protein